MLEFDDLQYIILTRVPATTGRYEFFSFHEPAQGRAWLTVFWTRLRPLNRPENSSSANRDGSPLHLPGKDFARLE